MRLLICLSILLLFMVSFVGQKQGAKVEPILGAWHQVQNGNDRIMLLQDGYFTHTTYNNDERRFVETHGGTFSLQGTTFERVVEFDTQNTEKIGTSKTCNFAIAGNELTIQDGPNKSVWTRVDDGNKNLAGTWKITARRQDGVITPIHQTGPRKTLKILSGTRFQWAAINPVTKEFFGTGGGTYTFTNGRYTEHIEFFSRDSSRVGAALSFDGRLEDGKWHHSGKSSRGDDIYEVWSRIE